MNKLVTPKTKKGIETRGRLLDAARTVALRFNGQIEIARIAEVAGVVPSVVHRYFGSKNGLVIAIVGEYYDSLDKQVFTQDLRGSGDWVQSEKLRLQMGIDFMYQEPFAQVIHGSFARAPEVACCERERISAVIDRTAKGIKFAQKIGTLPHHIDADLAGAAMFGALVQVISHALSRKRRPSKKAVFEVMWRQVVAAVDMADL